MPESFDALLSQEAAAEFLDVPYRYVQRLVDRREIGVVKVGRKNRFKIADLSRFVEKSRRPPGF